MARHPLQQWGMGAAAPLPRGQGLRPRLLVVVALCLTAVGWLFGLLGSGRGRLALALAFALLLVLGAHHRGGGVRLLARVVCEYALVGLLAALLVTIGTAATHPPPATHPSTASAAGAGGNRSVVVQVRDWLDQLKDRADQQAKRLNPPPTTTTRPHRRR